MSDFIVEAQQTMLQPHRPVVVSNFDVRVLQTDMQ
jgi:hypothetical protein